MVSLFIVLILVILSIIVAVQNADTVVFDLLFWNVEWPLAFLLILFFAIGIVIGIVGMLPHIVKKHRHVRAEKRKVAGLEQKVNETGKKLEEEYLHNRQSNIEDK